MLGKIEGRRRKGQQKVRWLDSTTDSMDLNLGRLQEIVRVREAWHAAVQRVGYDLATEQQQQPITSKEIESVIKNLLTKKSTGFTDKF